MSNHDNIALQLADRLDAVPETGADPELIEQAAAELRDLVAEVQRLNLYAKGADELVEVWKGRAQEFMNSRDRLLKANHSLWARIDILRASLGQPVAWIHTDPNNDRVRILDWNPDGRGFRGQWIKTPLHVGPPRRVGRAMRWELTNEQPKTGWCAGCTPDNCTGCGPGAPQPPNDEPAPWDGR